MMMMIEIKPFNYFSRIYPLIFFIFLLPISCQKRNSLTEENKGLSDLEDSASLRQLSSDVPMTREQLKNWIPNQIGEFNNTKLIIGYKEAVEMSAVKAIYQHPIDPSVHFVLEILDGAGPVASVLLIGSIQKLNLDFEEKKPSVISRIRDRNGMRVWESENTIEDIAELEFVFGGRFLVTLKGNHLRYEDLWVFADQLDFKGLR
jgi:hypothetical protein